MFFINVRKRKDESGLINILTRTSNRPIGFKKCFNSVYEQKYNKFRHIVSYDQREDLSYLKNYEVDKLKVNRRRLIKNDNSKKPGDQLYSPHNLYCNELIKKVKSGWIMFLDDDDMLINNEVLAKLHDFIRVGEKDYLFIWQMQYPDGTLIPSKKSFGDKAIKQYDIGSPCFLVHSEIAKKIKWDAWKCADFRFVKQVQDLVQETIWIEQPLVKLNNFGDLGNRNDIMIQ